MRCRISARVPRRIASRAAVLAALAAAALAGVATSGPAAGALAAQSAPARPAARAGRPVASFPGLTRSQRSDLLAIARDTWKFYGADIDPSTHLPMDNLTFAGGSAAPTGYGRYTSAANIGVYLWAVVAARISA